MKPDRPGTTRLLALVFAAWTAVGVLSFTTVALHFVVTERSAADGPLNLLHLLGCITANVWLWAILTLPIMAAADRWPVLGAHRRLRHVGVHVVLLMAVSALGGVEGTAVDLLITGRSDGALSNMLRMAPFDVLAYVGIVALRNGWRLSLHLSAERARADRLSSQLANSQLAVLRAQLHPHFFFNTLNAVAEMIHRDPEVADRMITRLGVFLRSSLDTSHVQEVPLEQELETLSAYLDIVRMRFGSRIDFAVDAASEALLVSVPPLILQPLVENAVRHGLEPSERGGLIRVTIRRRGDALHMEVRDNGVGLPPGDLRERVGLRNTRERLRQLYGENATFVIDDADGGGVVAAITLHRRFAAARPARRGTSSRTRAHSGIT